MQTKFKLAFDPEVIKIEELAREYDGVNTDKKTEDRIIDEVGPRTKANGYYTKEDFLCLCLWKTPRTQHHCERNDESFIRETTRFSLETPEERLRIEVLTLLDGVGWLTASVLLHFGHRERYPILDYRALESLSSSEPNQYTFPFWWDYVTTCRGLADRYGVSMRTLDRALWQHSARSKSPRV